ncbi:MAG: hypothetical protein HQ510_04180 [Candidatus Marinimicrobia bacterium]|nr:hypothetical protein [Candidatus Neomarinimicrobiota bacterium]
MLRKVFTTSIIIAGLFFVLNAAQNHETVCKNNVEKECWEYNQEKGWIYLAPVIEVTPQSETVGWSFDSEKGWIYHTETVEVLG